ncbi:MAG TPA: hypothetical protein VH575_30585 [Gemmataceae bacterium]
MRRALVCVLLLVMAGGLAAEDKLAETPYYPLRVGATWHYKAGEGKFTVRVAKHEKVGATLCARLETTREGKVVGSQHLAVTADGVYCHDQTVEGNVVQTPKPPILVLKLPPKKDDGWKIDSKADDQPFRGAFQIGEEEIKVAAGTYKTIRVTSQDLEVNGLKPVITTYYARDVGMVKQVIQENNVTLEIELEKFEAGK